MRSTRFKRITPYDVALVSVLHDNIIMKKTFDINELLGQGRHAPVADVVPYKGVMIYGHKTAGTIQVMDGASWSNWKSYQPGRYGRSATKKAGGKNTCYL